MNKRLRYLPISDVAEGMVLGAPLAIAEHGVTNFALPAGHVLSASNIRQMSLRHGEFACVEEADLRTDEERQAHWAAVEDRVDRIFAGADLSQDTMVAFRAAVLAYRRM